MMTVETTATWNRVMLGSSRCLVIVSGEKMRMRVRMWETDHDHWCTLLAYSETQIDAVSSHN